MWERLHMHHYIYLCLIFYNIFNITWQSEEKELFNLDKRHLKCLDLEGKGKIIISMLSYFC